ncbi:peroxiredoxin-6-like [Rhinophrynus dorsalis]
MVKVMPEFKKRNLKVFGLSLDTKENHLVWIKDINTFNGDGPKTTMPFPMIADPNRTIARLLGMVEADSKKSPGVPFTARHVFFIDPKKKLRLLLVYPPSCGRNFDEILRIADSLQITDKYGVSTEADWKVGDRVVVPANFPKDKAAEIFTKKVEIQEFPSGKQYLQFGELKK